MSSYRVRPIAESIASAARQEKKSPQYGHPAHVEIATGTGPCRSCLRTFEIGADNRLLFTYNPFDGLSNYPSPGPIFVHADACEPFDGTGIPAHLPTLPLVLEGYDDTRMVVERSAVADDDVDSVIERVFSNAAVKYIHIRNAEAGCFIALVERAHHFA